MAELPRNEGEQPQIKTFAELKADFEAKERKPQEFNFGRLKKEEIEGIANSFGLSIKLEEEKAFGRSYQKITFGGTDQEKEDFLNRLDVKAKEQEKWTR